MTLITQDLNILKKPFAAHDHEFLRGMAYITEHAISERIEEVDPAWELIVHEITVRENASKKDGEPYTVTVRTELKIKGVSRYGVGQSVVQATSDGNREANEAEKAAATDAFKRASRLFGIGRYLLTLPKEVRDEPSMARWLNGQGQAPQQPQPQVQIQPKAQVDEGAWDEATWKRNAFTVTKFMYTEPDGSYVEKRHSASMKKRMEDTGDLGIAHGMTLYEVINRVMKYRALTDMFLDSTDYPKIFGTVTLEAYVDKYSAGEAWQRLNQYYAAQIEPAKPKAS